MKECRKTQVPKTDKQAQVDNKVTVALHGEIKIVDSKAEPNKTPGFSFRSWHYATVLVRLGQKRDLTEVCADSGCTMSLIDRQFLKEQRPDLKINKTPSRITVKGIGGQIHESSEYILLEFFIPGTLGKSKIETMARITREFHIVDDLKANALIGMDILGPEGMILDFGRKRLIIGSCEDLAAPITITPKGVRVNRAVRSAKQVTVPAFSSQLVQVKLRGNAIPKDRDYSFFPKADMALGENGGIVASICDANLAAIEVRNATDKPYVVPKNLKLGHLQDFDEEGAYQASPEEHHQATVPSKGWKKVARFMAKASLTAMLLGSCWQGMQPSQTSSVAVLSGTEAPIAVANFGDEHLGPEVDPVIEQKLPNGITVYGNSDTRNKLQDTAAHYDIWRDAGGTIRIPEEDWMQIPTPADAKPDPVKVYPCSPEEREMIDKLHDEMHKQGKMEYTSGPTPYGFPVFVAWTTKLTPGKPPERVGRVVTDIRGLNKMTVIDGYPMPLQSYITGAVSGSPYISVFDCAGFFRQFLVRKEDRHKLTVVTHRGSERWNVAVMGYKNSPAYAQRQIDGILREFQEFAKAYIDDVVVFSATLEQHLDHLNKVFNLFEKYNIALKPSKTYLGYPSIALLGQRVDSLGMSTPIEKLEAIRKLKFPLTLNHLETYLGKTGYLRQYVPYYAQKAEPLMERKTWLLKASPSSKGRARKNFSRRTEISDPIDRELDAFEQLQDAFSKPSFLIHFDKTRCLYIDVDASKERGFGVMAFHVRKKGTDDETVPKAPPPRTDVEPILFLSKILSDAEKRYWPTELEMAAVVWAIRKLRLMVISSQHATTVITDHASNVTISGQTKLTSTSTDKLNLKLVRASMYLSQYKLNMIYKPGKSHLVPDALSRLPSTASMDSKTDSLDLDSAHAYNGVVAVMSQDFKSRVMKGYQDDKAWSSTIKMLKALTKRLDQEALNDPIPKEPASKAEKAKARRKTGVEFILIEDLIYHYKDDITRLCIPKGIEKEIFQLAHDKNTHAGHHRAYAKIVETLFIPRLSRKLALYIKHCPQCQLNQTKRHKEYGELMPISTPSFPFHTIAMDFILALPECEGFNCLLTVTDKFSRKHLLIKGKITWDAKDWAKAVLDMLQICDWGVPQGVISDRDPKFMSDFWRALFARLGTDLLTSTAYHAQTDGLSERTNQTVEIALRYLISENPDTLWTHALPALQMSLNNSVNATTGRVPNEIVYGFRVKEVISTMMEDKLRQRMKGRNEKEVEKAISLDRFIFQKEAQDATAHANIKAKILYDSRHQPLVLKPGQKAFLKLNKGYRLKEKGNRKLMNQRSGSFEVIRKVGRLAYELKLPEEWRVHPVISVTQLEPDPSTPDGDPFNRPRETQPGSVEVEGDTPTSKSWEIEKIVGKRTRKFGKANVTQYRIKWLGWGPEWNEWKSISALGNALDLVAEWEAHNKEPDIVDVQHSVTIF